MNNDDRIVELLTDSLVKQDEMAKQLGNVVIELKHVQEEQVKMREEQVKMREEQVKMKEEQVKMKEEQVKMTAHLAENTRAIIKLADKIEIIPALAERVTRLEVAVFKP